MSDSRPTAPRLESLQHLRALAALAVCASHIATEFRLDGPLRPLLLHGALGVDLFFVLSGCVLWISTAQLGTLPSTAADFLRRRLIRIVPLYWIATLALAAGVILLPKQFRSLSLHPGTLAASLLFLPQSVPPLLVVGWSLTFELFFYLVLAAGLLLPRLRMASLGILGILGISGLLFPSLAIGPWSLLLVSPFHLEFLAGILIGQLHLAGRLPPLRISLPLALGAMASMAWLEVPRSILCGLAGIGLLSSALRLETRYCLRKSILGEASYALYLVHVPLVVALARLWPQFCNISWLGALFALVVSQLLALAVWLWIDVPLQRWLR